jgi:hypothetical protein
MTTQPAASGPVPVSPNNDEKSSTVAKPTKTLPTERITVSKQLDILRAYAAASNNGTKPAPVNEVATIVKMAPSTVSLANAFLSSVGLITRTDTGSYNPSPEVLSFIRAYEWDKDTASYKLAPPLREAWFAKVLIPRLSFDSVEEDTAIALLAEASSAAPEYKKELRMILEFMTIAGIIKRDGNIVRLVAKELPEATVAPKQETALAEPSAARSNASGAVTTTFAEKPGAMSFNVSFQVDMSEFASWRPDRIQAFFRGIAEVLAAKADVEKGGQVS